MRTTNTILAGSCALLTAILVGCGGGGKNSGASSSSGGEGGAAGMAGAGGMGGSTAMGSGGAGNADVPMIGDALDCAKAASTGGLADGTDPSVMVRHDIDRNVFPDATCNDGTGAIFYFRPASKPADANKWVLHLQGGGSCSTPDTCAQRWCNTGTNFSLTQMSSSTSPKTDIDGKGILARASDGPLGDPNPIEGYNQVFVKYCSSDFWAGTARDVVLDGHHPKTMAPVTYRAHFLGRRILEAVIATLQQSGVAPLQYKGMAMADLDQAEEVVLAGASAGGAGTTNNADWMGALLRKTNPGLKNFVAIIDSAFAPDLVTQVKFDKSLGCSMAQICTSEQFLTATYDDQEKYWKVADDESCAVMHVAEPWRCSDDTHVVQNHVTTPMFVRMGLTDSLISDPFVKGGLTDETGATYDLMKFGLTVREQLVALPNIKNTAEEKAAMTTAPAAFGPICDKHETLRSTPDVFDVTIDAGMGPKTMFDLWTEWRNGTNPPALVTTTMADTVCVP